MIHAEASAIEICGDQLFLEHGLGVFA